MTPRAPARRGQDLGGQCLRDRDLREFRDLLLNFRGNFSYFFHFFTGSHWFEVST